MRFCHESIVINLALVTRSIAGLENQASVLYVLTLSASSELGFDLCCLIFVALCLYLSRHCFFALFFNFHFIQCKMKWTRAFLTNSVCGKFINNSPRGHQRWDILKSEISQKILVFLTKVYHQINVFSNSNSSSIFFSNLRFFSYVCATNIFSASLEE